MYDFGRTRHVAAGLVSCVALLAPPEAGAQVGCDGGGKYNVRLTPSAIEYGIVSPGDLDASQIFMGTMTVRVTPRGVTNKPWILCLRADEAHFGPAGKSVGDVEWQLAGSSGWQPASTGGQLVTRGHGNQRVDVLFRIVLDWDDVPGNYTAPLTFLAALQ